MKKLLWLISFILLLDVQYKAQDYFPLEIGNRWDYFVEYWDPGVSYWTDTVQMNIIGDTVLSNGNEYFVMNRYILNSRFVRADSNFIYIHIWDSVDFFFDLNAAVGTSYYIGEPYNSPHITVSGIDTTEIFGYQTRKIFYEIDGLVFYTLTLSDKFGPIQHSWNEAGSGKYRAFGA